jgi:hypothetical protein
MEGLPGSGLLHEVFFLKRGIPHGAQGLGESGKKKR